MATVLSFPKIQKKGKAAELMVGVIIMMMAMVRVMMLIRIRRTRKMLALAEVNDVDEHE